jgi:alkylated DNA repair protein (DNA oxidative demethylase)
MAPIASNPATLFPGEPRILAPGAVLIPGWLDARSQRRLVAACYAWADGRLRAPRMPNGSSMSVGIACLGWHWYPYRYSRTVDDGDGGPVSPFPRWLGRLARRAVDDALDVDQTVGDRHSSSASGDSGVLERYAPDVALVNWYTPKAKMGMHTDNEEPSSAPVVSVSVGDSCIFRFGTPQSRGRPWVDAVLASGDLVVFGGPSRRAYHGVPKVLAGSADPACGVSSGRFNVTIRESGLVDDTQPEAPHVAQREGRVRSRGRPRGVR